MELSALPPLGSVVLRSSNPSSEPSGVLEVRDGRVRAAAIEGEYTFYRSLAERSMVNLGPEYVELRRRRGHLYACCIRYDTRRPRRHRRQTRFPVDSDGIYWFNSDGLVRSTRFVYRGANGAQDTKPGGTMGSRPHIRLIQPRHRRIHIHFLEGVVSVSDHSSTPGRQLSVGESVEIGNQTISLSYRRRNPLQWLRRAPRQLQVTCLDERQRFHGPRIQTDEVKHTEVLEREGTYLLSCEGLFDFRKPLPPVQLQAS